MQAVDNELVRDVRVGFHGILLADEQVRVQEASLGRLEYTGGRGAIQRKQQKRVVTLTGSNQGRELLCRAAAAVPAQRRSRTAGLAAGTGRTGLRGGAQAGATGGGGASVAGAAAVVAFWRASSLSRRFSSFFCFLASSRWRLAKA